MRKSGKTRILDDISFDLREGEILAIIGESGSGKTTLCRLLSRLGTESDGFKIRGEVRLDGLELLSAEENELARIRRNDIRHIFQEPASAFNPLRRIGSVINDVITISRPETTAPLIEPEIEQLFDNLQLGNPKSLWRMYPHELSIGMLQRIMIAIALLTEPRILVADEPTNAVDPSQRWQIIDLIQSYRKRSKMAIVLATHDLELACTFADHVIVLYRGRIVESRTASEFFRCPLHSYSKMLIGGNNNLSDYDPMIDDGFNFAGSQERSNMEADFPRVQHYNYDKREQYQPHKSLRDGT